MRQIQFTRKQQPPFRATVQTSTSGKSAKSGNRAASGLSHSKIDRADDAPAAKARRAEKTACPMRYIPIAPTFVCTTTTARPVKDGNSRQLARRFSS